MLGLEHTIRVCPYPPRFCLTLVWGRQERAIATESERGRYETDDVLMFCLPPSFGRRDTPPFACATGVRDGRKHLGYVYVGAAINDQSADKSGDKGCAKISFFDVFIVELS